VASDNESFRDLKIIELSRAEWMKILDFSKNLKIKVIVEPFDFDSFDFIKNHPAIEAFKIPTSDVLDPKFLNGVLSQEKKVFIATGGAEIDELDKVLAVAEKYPKTGVVLLHGFQNFPTKLEDSHLNKIHSLQKRFKCRIGFADHIDAENQELSRLLPSMAIAAGASVIEKHLTLDRSERSYDFYSALNPDEFNQFVRHIRAIDSALGSSDLSNLSNAELEYRHNMKKFAVAAEDIQIGDNVDEAKIVFRRTSSPGMTHSEIKSLMNKKFSCTLKKHTLICGDHIDG
jgi:sialic acid synthase SpsE